MSKKILLVGGGGHCKSVLDSLLAKNEYSEIGVVEKKGDVRKEILGIPIIGDDDELPRLFSEGYFYAFVTVGSIGNPRLRIKLFKTLEEIGFEIPNIIDQTAIISNNVKLENGIYVGKNAVINTGSFINKGAIINTSTVIEHDCIIGEFTHIAPAAVLCGEVQVDANSHIGARSVIKQQTKIGSNTIIGMGSTVVTDIRDNVTAYGSPCREVQSK